MQCTHSCLCKVALSNQRTVPTRVHNTAAFPHQLDMMMWKETTRYRSFRQGRSRGAIFFAFLVLTCIPFFLVSLLESVNSHGSRQDMMFEARVMVLHTSTLVPDLKGSDLRIYQVIVALRQMGYDVTYCFVRTEVPELTSHRHSLKLLSLGVRLMGPVAYNLDMFRIEVSSHQYLAVLEWLWPNPQYLYTLSEGINSILTQHSKQTAIVAVSDDLMAERLDTENDFGDQNSYLRPDHLFLVEKMFWRQADIVAGVSSLIADAVGDAVPQQTTRLLRFGLELKDRGIQSASTQDVLWFGYNNPANRAAVKFIVENLQNIEAKEKERHFTVHIVGGVEDMGCSAQLGCQYYGALPEIELIRHLHRSRWVIAPLLSPAGVSTKIIKALSHGVPVLTTKFGAKYFPNTEDIFSPVVVADKESFFDVLAFNYLDLDGNERRRQNIKRYALESFDMSFMRRDLRDILETVRAMETAKRKPVKLRRSIIWDLDESNVDAAIAKKIISTIKDNVKTFDVLQVQDCRNRMVDVYVKFSGLSRPNCCPKHSCHLIYCLSPMI